MAHSPSIYPDDPESTHYDPLVYADHGPSGHDALHWPTTPRPKVSIQRACAPVSAPEQLQRTLAPPRADLLNLRVFDVVISYLRSLTQKTRVIFRRRMP